MALVAVGAAVAATLDGSRCQRAAGCSADPVKSSLSGVWVAQVTVAVLGVLAMSSEYDTPQIRLTLAAMPRRLPVMVAKATVVAGLVVAAGAIGTCLALVAGRSVLAANGFGAAAGSPRWSLTGGLTVRAALGTVGYLVLVATLALGVAAVVRDAAVAIVSVLGLLFLFPLLGLVLTDATWQHRLHRYSPMDAGLAVQATRGLDHLVNRPLGRPGRPRRLQRRHPPRRHEHLPDPRLLTSRRGDGRRSQRQPAGMMAGVPSTTRVALVTGEAR